LLHLLEAHAGKAALVDEELLGRVVVEDRDALMLGVLDLPGRSLHHPPRRADRDLHVHAAEAKPGPAAVHRRIAAADDDHALADRVHVLEGHRGEPIDADMDVGLAFLAAGNAQVLALGRSSAHEDRVEAFRQQGIEALDLVAEASLHPEAEDAVDLLVQHARGQAERGNVGAHQAAAPGVLLEQHARVAERQKITRDSERGRPRADERYALAVLLRRNIGHEGVDLALVIRGDTLQAADGNRLLLHAAAPACGLAGAIADPAEDARKDVALPIEHVCGRIAALRNQPDIFGYGGVRRTGPLAVDDLVEILRIGNVGRGRAPPASLCDFARLHSALSLSPPQA